MRTLPPLLILLLSLGAVPARAVEDSPFGINIHAPQGAELETLLDRAQAAGIGWVRIDFVWAYVESSRDRFDWHGYDVIAAEARERGLEVFATLAYTPGWATSGPEWTGVPDAAEWSDFCFRAARRYKGQIRYWGLWNEANLPKFWSGTRQQYIDVILKPGADAIHAGNPDARVGGPELAHLTSGDSDWYDWLRESILAAGDRLDFVTHHVYDTDGNRDVTAKLEGSTVFGNRPDFWDTVAPSVEEVLRNTGWLGKPFWITETGWESSRVNESRQASYSSGLLSDWFSHPPGRPGRDWVHKVFFYEMKDGTAADSPSWGLLRPNGSPKPAYSAIRTFTADWAEANGRVLELLGDRFAVQATWRDTAGRTGYAQAVPDSDQTGFFWFFGKDNLELAVKALDGRTYNNRYWIYYGALSDVEYWISVTDRQTGEVRLYHNPPGNLCGRGDSAAFLGTPSSTASTAAGTFEAEPLIFQGAPACAAGPNALCLLGGRFRVEVEWRRGDGVEGRGKAVPRTDESGTFWFFGQDNIELVVKVLDGRWLTGKFWFYYGALSDVEYWITLTDTQTGASKRYHNPPGTFCGRGDTQAM